MCCHPYRFAMLPLQMGSLCLLFFTFLFLLCIQTGEAIICFECNSHNDTRCAQELPPDLFKKDCSDHKEGAKFTLCRKITQSIEFEVNGLKPDTRIIRVCGWDTSNYVDKCYQRSGFGGRQEVCTCTTDLCNSADSFKTPIATMALVTALQIAAAKLLF